MATKLDGLQKWEKSIRASAGNWRIKQNMHLVPKDDKGKRVLEQLSQPEFFKDALAEFTKEQFLQPGGVLYVEFHRHSDAGTEYFPHFLSKHDREGDALPAGLRHSTGKGTGGGKAKVKRYTDEWVNMQQGFAALWSAISQKPVFTVQGSEAVAQIGPWSQVGSLKLSDYMGVGRKRSPASGSPNNLFYAVEYGTGVKDNVGGPANVRHDGPTKNPDGSWWFNVQTNGGLFTGQKGFHFLYDARTRMPRDVYIDRVRRFFPAFMEKKLGDSIGLS